MNVDDLQGFALFVVFLAIGLYLIWLAYSAGKTGQLASRGGVIQRKTSPFLFKIGVIIYYAIGFGFVGLMVFLLAASLLEDIIRPNDASDFYPENARKAKIGGQVMIECRVAAGQHLEQCQVLSEAPAGYGFGQATIKAITADPPENVKTRQVGDEMKVNYIWKPDT